MPTPFPWMDVEKLAFSQIRETELLHKLSELENARHQIFLKLRPVLADIAEVEREVATLRTWREQLKRSSVQATKLAPATRPSTGRKPRAKKAATVDPSTLTLSDLQALISKLQSL